MNQENQQRNQNRIKAMTTEREMICIITALFRLIRFNHLRLGDGFLFVSLLRLLLLVVCVRLFRLSWFAGLARIKINAQVFIHQLL